MEVYTEKDELSIIQDLNTFVEGAEIINFPWWQTVPYRCCPIGSITFGKRAGALSKLAMPDTRQVTSKKSRIFIMNQRAFLTPVPPPEYIRKNSFSLEINPLFLPPGIIKSSQFESSLTFNVEFESVKILFSSSSC